MPLYRANVIVLRRRAFQETDKLLTLYSREHGKLSAIARGARRAQSRLVGATEPLVYARMQLATGRNLDIITEATPRHTFPGLRTSARKVQVALYMAELLDALVEERQSSPEQFDLMLSSLYLLEGKPLDALVVRRFEMQMIYAGASSLRGGPRGARGRPSRGLFGGDGRHRLRALPSGAASPAARLWGGAGCHGSASPPARAPVGAVRAGRRLEP